MNITDMKIAMNESFPSRHPTHKIADKYGMSILMCAAVTDMMHPYLLDAVYFVLGKWQLSGWIIVKLHI